MSLPLDRPYGVLQCKRDDFGEPQWALNVTCMKWSFVLGVDHPMPDSQHSKPLPVNNSWSKLELVFHMFSLGWNMLAGACPESFRPDSAGVPEGLPGQK